MRHLPPSIPQSHLRIFRQPGILCIPSCWVLVEFLPRYLHLLSQMLGMRDIPSGQIRAILFDKPRSESHTHDMGN